MKNILSIIICVSMIGITFFVTYHLLKNQMNKELDEQKDYYENLLDKMSDKTNDDTQVPKLPTKETITVNIIEDKLRDISFLVTEEYYFKEVSQYDSSVTGLFDIAIPLTNSNAIYSYDGVITAGIDVEKIKVDKDDDHKLITIDMPKATILSTDIDYDSFILYTENESIFNKISVKDNNDVLKNIKSKANKSAKEKGILEKSEKNAQRVIREFVNNMNGLEDYKIMYTNK